MRKRSKVNGLKNPYVTEMKKVSILLDPPSSELPRHVPTRAVNYLHLRKLGDVKYASRSIRLIS